MKKISKTYVDKKEEGGVGEGVRKGKKGLNEESERVRARGRGR